RRRARAHTRQAGGLPLAQQSLGQRPPRFGAAALRAPPPTARLHWAKRDSATAMSTLEGSIRRLWGPGPRAPGDLALPLVTAGQPRSTRLHSPAVAWSAAPSCYGRESSELYRSSAGLG